MVNRECGWVCARVHEHVNGGWVCARVHEHVNGGWVCARVHEHVNGLVTMTSVQPCMGLTIVT